MERLAFRYDRHEEIVRYFGWDQVGLSFCSHDLSP